MYTQCPECLSVFSLDAQTLAKAHGHVVCGHCEASFDSLATLARATHPIGSDSALRELVATAFENLGGWRMAMVATPGR